MERAIAEEQDRIVEEFSRVGDWEERYRKIIALGKELPPIEDLPAEVRDEKFRVRGCQSTVYLKPALGDGRVHFTATSDALIVRGLIALLLRVYSDRTPDQILATRPDFIERIGLSQNLSQGRANGLAAMLEQIRLYALAFKAMQMRSQGPAQ